MEILRMFITRSGHFRMSLPRKATSSGSVGYRKMSTDFESGGEIKVELDSESGIALMKWNRKPVNALSYNFLQSNLEIYGSLESNPSCRGIILTSAIPNIFSSGLDLRTFLEKDREDLANLVKGLSNLLEVYSFGRLPIVTAINGHAPAGGCVIAMSTDYRIMKSGVGRIGLNESAIGLTVPESAMAACKNLLGTRKAELAILLGTLFCPEEALAVGLVDELATDEEDLLRKAKDQVVKFAAVPGDVYIKSKTILRKNVLDASTTGGKNTRNFETTVDQMMSARSIIQQHIENLRNKKKIGS